MWTSKPTPEEVVKWFNTVELHEGLDHAKYVGGIVAIENFQTKQWNPFVLAATRIAYFWDWVAYNDYEATFKTSDPVIMEMPFAPGPDGTTLVANSLYMAATVEVWQPGEGGNVLRASTGRKQVSLNVKINRGQKTIPNYDAIMKAETGAIARAVAQIGMLALPGSGIASAEDMHDFIREHGVPEVDPTAPEPPTRRAQNPKQAVSA